MVHLQRRALLPWMLAAILAGMACRVLDYDPIAVAVTYACLMVSALVCRTKGQSGTAVAPVLQGLLQGERFVVIPHLGEPGERGRVAGLLDQVRNHFLELDSIRAEKDAERARRLQADENREVFIAGFDREVRQVMEALTQASHELAQTAGSLADQAALTQTFSRSVDTSVHSTVRSVDTVVHSSEELISAIASTKDKAEQARAIVGGAVSGLDQTASTMSTLSEAADRIGSVLSLIREIAGQTNLLALNATIESARAGEAGKGFAIVAGEVKTLASQTSRATEDIERQVTGIGNAVRQVVNSIGENVRHISTLDSVTGMVVKTAADEKGLTDEIGEKARQALSNSQVLAQQAGQVQAAADVASQIAGQVLTSAQSIGGQAQGLRRAVDAFVGNLRTGSIKVGALFSLSGTMAISEKPLRDVTQMLVNRVNAQGGLLGRPLELVTCDPRSDWNLYPELGRQLLVDEQVDVIFGCWTSSSRKALLPVVEQHDGLLFYGVQYEGEEQSPNIFYTGATPNQQALPAVDYLMSPQGGGFRRFYLVGTDYVYPQTANAIIRGYLRHSGIPDAHVRMCLTPFGHQDWGGVVKDIAKMRSGGPVAVISTINGDANLHFYRELAEQGLSASEIPVMAFSIGEPEVRAIGARHLQGHLCAWNYFQSLETPENQAFIDAFRTFTGDPSAMTSDPVEAIAVAFEFWIRAVERAGSTDTAAIRTALAGLRVRGLGGMDLCMDLENHHTHKPALIGKIGGDGAITVVWRSDGTVVPLPQSPWLASAPLALSA